MNAQLDDMEPGVRWFHTLLVPLAWAGCSLVHYRHPGDEYAMYAISSIAGSWVLFLVPVGDIHNLLIPISVALVGGTVMAGLGWGLSGLRVRPVLWGILFVVASVTLLMLSINAYPSIERALAKNGSWWAYACSSIEVGMYAAGLLSALVTGAVRIWRRFRSARVLMREACVENDGD